MFNFCLSVISKGFQSAAVLKIRPSPPSFEGFGLDIHSYLFRQFTKFTKIAYIDITLTWMFFLSPQINLNSKYLTLIKLELEDHVDLVTKHHLSRVALNY